MTMDLFDYGLRRLTEHPRPDWKRDLARLYDEWAVAPEDRRPQIEREMVLAYAPLLVHVARRYHVRGDGLTRRDSFEIGLTSFSESLRRFDPDVSPRGSLAFSSWLVNLAENGMRSAVRTSLTQRRSLCQTVSIDDDSDVYARAAVSMDDERVATAGEESVRAVVMRAIGEMGHVDAIIARMILLDEATREEVLGALSDAGVDMTINALRSRYHDVVLPRLRAELVRAGYGYEEGYDG